MGSSTQEFCFQVREGRLRAKVGENMKVMAGPALVQAEETLEFLSTAGVPAGTTLTFQGTGLAVVTLLKKCKGGVSIQKITWHNLVHN